MNVGNTSINFETLRNQLGNSIRLGSAALSIIHQRRKSNLKMHIDNKFHYLTRDSNPVMSLLFGDNVEQSITESAKVLEVARKVSKSRSRDMRPRGRYFNNSYKGRTFSATYGYRGRPYQSPGFSYPSPSIRRGWPFRRYQQNNSFTKPSNFYNQNKYQGRPRGTQGHGRSSYRSKRP